MPPFINIKHQLQQLSSNVTNAIASTLTRGGRWFKINGKESMNEYAQNSFQTLTESVHSVAKIAGEPFSTFLWWIKLVLVVIIFVVILYFVIKIRQYFCCTCLSCCSTRRKSLKWFFLYDVASVDRISNEKFILLNENLIKIIMTIIIFSLLPSIDKFWFHESFIQQKRNKKNYDVDARIAWIV